MSNINNQTQVSLEDLIEAYMGCRKRKRKTFNSLKFEVNWEENLYQLWKEINLIDNQHYEISRSITFIVIKGVKAPREVFAAHFRDRIVHHLLHNKLYPLLIEHLFVRRRYNSIKGYGTLDSSGQVYRDILATSNNFTEDAWVCKIDIKNFFMAINRKILWRKLRRFIKDYYHEPDKPTILRLTKMVALNNPVVGCYKKSPDKAWLLVPKHKSLFNAPKNTGLAIGNLTSQLFANVYLSEPDHVVEEIIPLHVAFVDDHAFVNKDPEVIFEGIRRYREALAKVKLELNEHKFYMQPSFRGIKFTGCQIHKWRRYPTKRVLTNAIRFIYGYNHLIKRVKVTDKMLTHFISGINSYTGIMKHFHSYNIRRDCLSKIGSDWYKYMYISGHYEKVTLKRRYLLPYRYLRRKDYPKIYGY